MLGEIKRNGIVYARKCLKKVHYNITDIYSRDEPLSREETRAVHLGQVKYFKLMARHNILAEKAFHNASYSVSSIDGRVSSVEEVESDEPLEFSLIHKRLSPPSPVVNTTTAARSR